MKCAARKTAPVWRRAAAVCLLLLVVAIPAAWAQQAKHFSVDFVETEVADVLKALAAQSGVNVAMNGSAQGTVTLRLSGVTLEQALTIITQLNGLDYALFAETYVVGKPDEVAPIKARTYVSSTVGLQRLAAATAQETLGKIAPGVTATAQPGTNAILLVGAPGAVEKAEATLRKMDASAADVPPVTEVASLKYLPPSQAKAILIAAVSGISAAEGPTGTLVLTGDPQQIARAKSVLGGVDVIPAVGTAEREIYSVRYAEAKELAEKLTELMPDLKVTLGPRSATPSVTASTSSGSALGTAALSAPQMGEAQGKEGASEVSPVTVLILSGSRPTLDRALELLKQIDVAPRQVTISATITEIQKGALKQLGIDWVGLAGKTGVIVGEPMPAQGGSSSGGTQTGLTDTIARELKLGRFMRSPLQFTGVLSALVSRNQAKVLANPSITLLDGRQAAIHAGEKIYFPQVVGYDPLGGKIVTATQIDVGVTLVVRPRVSDNGDITLTLVPTVSAIIDSVFPDYPTITERSTVTTVRVKSGETFVLGGLVRDEEMVTSSRVPILGDLPIVGRLFRFERRQPQHTEILIVITPTIKEDSD